MTDWILFTRFGMKPDETLRVFSHRKQNGRGQLSVALLNGAVSKMATSHASTTWRRSYDETTSRFSNVLTHSLILPILLESGSKDHCFRFSRLIMPVGRERLRLMRL